MGPGWAQRFTAANPSLVHAGAFLALITEPVVAAGLLVPRTRRLASVVAVAFHLLVRVFMGIDFLPMAACAAIAGWATDARTRDHRVRRAQSVRIVRSPMSDRAIPARELLLESDVAEASSQELSLSLS